MMKIINKENLRSKVMLLIVFPLFGISTLLCAQDKTAKRNDFSIIPTNLMKLNLQNEDNPSPIILESQSGCFEDNSNNQSSGRSPLILSRDIELREDSPSIFFPMNLVNNIINKENDEKNILNLKESKINRKEPDMLFRRNALLIKDIDNHYVTVLSYVNIEKVSLRLNGQKISEEEFNKKEKLNIEKISLPYGVFSENELVIEIETK